MNINPIKLYKYQKVYKIIKNSGLFDSKYYLFNYPDVRNQDIDPIKHYILNGAKERRNPSAHFDTNYYLNTYKDIDLNKINPLFHYIVYGQKEGRLSVSNKTIKKNNSKSFYLDSKNNKNKLNICLLVPGGIEKGESSTYIRLINPLFLIQDKVNIIISPREINFNELSRFDICILQRNAIDNAENAKKLIEILKNNKIPLVVDIDDAFGITSKHSLNPYMKKMESIIAFLMNNADMIWFSTHQLADFYNNKKCQNQYVIPNALDKALWTNNRIKQKSEKIRFVYMGTSTHDEDFYELLLPAFKKLHIKYSNKFELTIVGALKKFPSENWIKVENIPGGFMKYPDFVKWFVNNSQYDIGLSPLTINDFNNCKTDIKFLDYLALGCVPMLSKCKAYDKNEISDYSIIVENNKWFEEIEKIIKNPNLLEDKKKSDVSKYLWEERSLYKNSSFMYDKILQLFQRQKNKIDCLISCWLGVDDILIDGLISLEKKLNSRGINSNFIVSGKIVEEKLNKLLNHKVIFSPAIISRSDINENYLNNKKVVFKSLCHVDTIWTKKKQSIEKISSVYAYWKEYLLNHQVKHMLIWGNTAPMSQLFIMLCQELEVEYTIIERGHFSGTLLADSLGQLGFGTKQKQFENNKMSLLSESYKKERMKEIISWIEKGTTSQYAEKNQKETDELKEILKKKKDKKILLFLGANDLGSGMKDLNTKPRANTWFRNSQDALNSLVEVLPNKFDDVLLVIKPHPSANLEVSDKLSNNNYIFANTTSINELIKNADVCVTTTSTVLGYCVAFGKPTLQFGITDSTNSNEIYDVWHPSVIASYLRDALNEQFFIDKKDGYSEYVLNLFDSHLIRVNEEVPTRLNINDFASHLFNRVYKGVNSYEYDIVHNSPEVSKKLYDDIANRDRKYYDLNLIDTIDEKELPKLAIIIPVYDDLVGLRRNVERVVKYREDNNNYDIVLIWDCGPNIETLEYCREAQEKYGIDLIENKVNIGFSGTVNKGILKYKTHDVIVHNSDTIVHSDWAIRMQKSAYVDEEIGSVNPLSNNATLNNVPFPNGIPFPKEPIEFVEYIDSIAKKELKVAVEAPVSHGFCVFIKRSIIDIIGLFDEQKFGKGHSEDNEYSMRIRSKGFKCITTTNVFVGHDGGTSFKEDSEPWKNNGRKIMREEFPNYFDEIRLFFHNDPISKERKVLESHFKRFF
ncbi:glycosyltransferase [Aliarcobacter thereius]|uniref:Glycosyltransferase n=1 Tax=Aliarcobacter thereius TaxID=544718 RepID=A0A5R9GYI3_9BACT|nr:glycosyltransferase [Aliarcobacter thereius]TLS71834.1 glycosyltransferase [Aliarcobacter thereius]